MNSSTTLYRANFEPIGWEQVRAFIKSKYGAIVSPEAYGVTIMANGAIRNLYKAPTPREKALSRTTQKHCVAVISSNYRYKQRKRNSKGAVIKKNTGRILG